MAQNTNKRLNIFLVFTVSFKTTNFNFPFMNLVLSKDNIEYYFPFLFGDEKQITVKHGQIIHSMWMTGYAFLEEISWNGSMVYQVVTTISISRSTEKEIPTPSVPEG